MWRKLLYANLLLWAGFMGFSSVELCAQRADLISRHTEWYFGAVNEDCAREYIHIYYAGDTILGGQDAFVFPQDKFVPDAPVERMDTFYFYADTNRLYAWDRAVNDFRMLMQVDSLDTLKIGEIMEPTALPWYTWGNMKLECPPDYCVMEGRVLKYDTVYIEDFPVIVQTFQPSHITGNNGYSGEFAQYIGFWKTGVFNFFNHNMDFWGTCDPLLMCFKNEHFSYKNYEISCDSIDNWLTSTELLHTPQKNNIKIYPNPAGNTLNISLDNAILRSVVIYDLSGREVFAETVSDATARKHQLNLSQLPPGAYVMKVETGNGNVIKKLIKQ